MKAGLDLAVAWSSLAVGVPLAFYLGFAFPSGGNWRTAVATMAAFLLAGSGIELCARIGYCYAGERVSDAVIPLFAFPLYWIAVNLGIQLKHARSIPKD